ncbi:tetratricopeptide repeat protein [Porphyrobacter sp. ULC335]|jgi:tetratricopeptide (TPR) repeat protein|uniref:tetratricopeptide repeat protein n=1 Tax=Porphyrobacter sp. ULC335 TaxID=2854260 RepID=UPI00221F2A95|nr:tetratricopeptide repeat protein [Porphyrobacter sp. ULC335]UYV15503.1 tetratricopeptide repeat protein [Porphyrobacter sp. ULC335]
MSVTAFAIALIAATPLAAAPAMPVPALAEATELAVQPLAAGRADQALATLEKASIADPHDAAVLINLGIAYAQAGDDAKARAAFEQALACHEVIELDTADGSATDSRRLARKAIKMLERGEFRPAPTRAGQLTLRD